MKRLLLALLVAGIAFAQQPAADLPSLPDGTQFVTVLQTELNVKKAKVGDPVRLETLRPVLVKGKVAIPEGAKLWGRVTEVVISSGASSESRLAILVDRAEWKARRVRQSLALHAVAVRQGRIVQRVQRSISQSLDDPSSDPLLVASRDLPEEVKDNSAIIVPTAPNDAAGLPTQIHGDKPSGAGNEYWREASEQSRPKPAITESSTFLGPAVEGVRIRRGDPALGNVFVSAKKPVRVHRGSLLVLVNRRKAAPVAQP